MAASFTIAARNNGFSKADARAATMASVAAYREAMAEFAQMGTMEIWYAHLAEDDIRASIRAAVGAAEHHDKAARARQDREGREGQDEREGKAASTTARCSGRQDRREDPAQGAHPGQPAGAVEARRAGRRRVPDRQPAADRGAAARARRPSYGISGDETEQIIRDQFRAYRATLQDDRRHLLERFEVVDMARKVVGVGSVGTRAFIVLLQGRDAHDPLFLQVKEATASVLEEYLPKSRYAQPGERVVQGQRMMQAASDIFLGWTKGVAGRPVLLLAPAARHEGLGGGRGDDPARAHASTPGICGWTLARAHARSGDPVAIAAYLGDGDTFDRSITDFSARYADQNEQDYQAFVKAVRSGRLQAVEGV